MKKKVPFIFNFVILIYAMSMLIFSLIFKKFLFTILFHKIVVICTFFVMSIGVPFTLFKIIKGGKHNSSHIFPWYFLLFGYMIGWLSKWLNSTPITYISIAILISGIVFSIRGIYKISLED